MTLVTLISWRRIAADFHPSSSVQRANRRAQAAATSAPPCTTGEADLGYAGVCDQLAAQIAVVMEHTDHPLGQIELADRLGKKLGGANGFGFRISGLPAAIAPVSFTLA